VRVSLAGPPCFALALVVVRPRILRSQAGTIHERLDVDVARLTGDQCNEGWSGKADRQLIGESASGNASEVFLRDQVVEIHHDPDTVRLSVDGQDQQWKALSAAAIN